MHRPRVIIAALVVLLAFVMSSCSSTNTTQEGDGKLVVLASIAPLYSFCKEIGGDKAEVHLMVPPGASPHTYTLKPEQMKLVSTADMLVINGAGLEFWADKAVDAAENKSLLIVDTSKHIDLITELGPTGTEPHASGMHPVHEMEKEGHEHAGHDHGPANPHFWLAPALAMVQVENIRDAFVKKDPDNAGYYKSNADDLIARLDGLDKDIRKRVDGFSEKDFVAFHSAWLYFAREYGLSQVAVVEETPGKGPTSKDVRHVIDTIKRTGAKAVFAEPQFSAKSAEVIAKEAGVEVLTLDPLGEPPDYDYFEMMYSNIEEMAKALK